MTIDLFLQSFCDHERKDFKNHQRFDNWILATNGFYAVQVPAHLTVAAKGEGENLLNTILNQLKPHYQVKQSIATEQLRELLKDVPKIMVPIDCPYCNGNGSFWDGDSDPEPTICDKCEGTGNSDAEREEYTSTLAIVLNGVSFPPKTMEKLLLAADFFKVPVIQNDYRNDHGVNRFILGKDCFFYAMSVYPRDDCHMSYIPTFNLDEAEKELNIKEHPIIFSPIMVTALLNGTKTQTRRIIEDSFNGCWTGTNGGIQVGGHPCPNDPVVIHPGEMIRSYYPEYDDNLDVLDYPDEPATNTVVEAWFHCSTMDKTARCPYGKIGDVLWVRETCQILGHWKKNGTTKSGKQAWKFIIHPDQKVRYAEDFERAPKDRTQLGYYTRPSIHCPKWTSRINLLVTDIRVERLQSITEEDAIAEGIEILACSTDRVFYKNYRPDPDSIFGNDKSLFSPRASYMSLWDAINGKDAHTVNPWVWAITFKHVNS